MSNQSVFALLPIATDANTAQKSGSECTESDKILALAREAGMLVTLDGQIGREKYQSIAGSVASFRRFAEALLCMTVQA
jgi:hypothetical protein